MIRPVVPRQVDEPQLTLAEQGFWNGVPRWVFVFVAAVGDVMNFKVVVAELLPELVDYQTWLLVAAFTAAAVGPAQFAGAALRRTQRPGRFGVGRILVVVFLGLIWFGLGLVASWIRLTRTTGQDPLAGLDGSSDGSPAGGLPDFDFAEMPMTVLFLLLFLAGGLMAFWIALDHGPSRLEMLGRHRRLGRPARREQRRRKQAPRRTASGPRAYRYDVARHARATVEVERIERTVELVRADAGRDGERRAKQLAATVAWAEELKQLARVALAARVGDPAGTSAIGHQQPLQHQL